MNAYCPRTVLFHVERTLGSRQDLCVEGPGATYWNNKYDIIVIINHLVKLSNNRKYLQYIISDKILYKRYIFFYSDVWANIQEIYHETSLRIATSRAEWCRRLNERLKKAGKIKLYNVFRNHRRLKNVNRPLRYSDLRS